MPYRRVSELPDAVRKHLPVHAQSIYYMKAFNSALGAALGPKEAPR